MDCTAVIVNWNSADLLRPCIQSLRKSGDIQIVVVDNNSSDNSRKVLKSLKNIEVIFNQENYGFGKACNQGARLAKGEYLLFLNPDVEVSPDTTRIMTKFLDINEHTGIVGPKFLSVKGVPQSGYYLKYPTAFQVLFFYTKLKNRFTSKFIRELFYEQQLSTIPEPVDQVPGAALMIRKSIFKKLNGFREDYFLWFEDVDLCRRTHTLGKKIYYLPFSEVKHQGGGSFKKWTQVAEKKKRFYKSMRLYFAYNKNFLSYLLISLIPEKYLL